MTTHDVVLAARLPVARASVRAGTVETTYWRAGAGPTVILLDTHPERDEAFVAQVVRLAAHCRLVVPEHVSLDALTAGTAARQSAFAGWLCHFIEGLGICGAHIVAAPEFADAVRRLGDTASELVGSVIVLSGHPPDISRRPCTAGGDGSLADQVAEGDDWCDVVVRRLQGAPRERAGG